MIYFVSCPDVKAIKIGYSRSDPRLRAGVLQLQSPHEMMLLGVIDGDMDAERSIHQSLADFKIRGEWFQDCDAVRAMLAMGDEAAIIVGPPKVKHKHAVLHISRELRRRLRAAAQVEGRTVSMQGEWMLEKALDARDKKGRKP